MPSERVQANIDRLLAESDAAIAQDDWALLRRLAGRILTLDPDNPDAPALLAAAERGLASEGTGDREQVTGSASGSVGEGLAPSRPEPMAPAVPVPTTADSPLPIAFASGRYQVTRFLGEGGKKKVYLAHDTLLDRDVAFALIKTEGLDDAGRDRIRREAQAMGRLGSHPHIVSVFDLGEEPDGPHPGPLPILGEGAQSAEAPLSGSAGEGPGVRPRGQPYIVTELMGGGDVEGLIQKAPDHRPPLERSLEMPSKSVAASSSPTLTASSTATSSPATSG